jgi:heat shock protein HslJ
MQSKVLLVTLIFLACASASTSELSDREWRMESVEGFTTMPAGVATPTVRFGTDGRFSGNTGCNSAGATYTAKGDQLNIGMMTMTKRACLDPEGNRLEHAYAEAIGKTRRFRIADGQLELLSAEGAALARFR